MTCNKVAYNNHGLNINLYQDEQDEQEVTVKRMSLWHVALLIDNQRTTSYQPMYLQRNWCVCATNKQAIINRDENCSITMM